MIPRKNGVIIGMVKPQKVGKHVRMSFSKIDEALEMPNLIEVQKKSYQWFLDEGLMEVLRDVSPITDYSGNLFIDFMSYSLDSKPKYPVEECKDRDVNYAAPLKVRVRLSNKLTGLVTESEIFMGDFPLMTDSATFVINGAEGVVVSQLVRSPGVYFDKTRDKSGKELFSAQVIPNRGAWLKYEKVLNDIFYVRIDKNRKMPVTVFLRALGLGTNQEILDFFGTDERLELTLSKDTTASVDDGLLETYRKIRPGELPTIESARNYLNNLFFDPRRYDMAHFGRYKFNKKLSLVPRIYGRTLSRPAVDPFTGVVLAEAGQVLTKDVANEIAESGLNEVWIRLEEEKEMKVLSNGTVDMSKFVSFDPAEVGISEKVSLSVLSNILENCKTQEEIKEACASRFD